MLRFIFMTLSLFAMIVINIAANLIPFNGKTTWEIANRLPALFTPAGYVFIILAIIYGLLIMWLVRFEQENQTIDPGMKAYRAFLFISSCLLNIIWILFWHSSLFEWTIVTIFILFLSLLALYMTYPKKTSVLFGRTPIAVYLGFVFILMIGNVSYVLMLHEWSGWGISDPLWTVAYLTITTAFALHFMYHHHDVPLNIVFIWTFIGIAFRNGTDELFVTAASIFLASVIGVCIFLFKRT